MRTLALCIRVGMLSAVMGLIPRVASAQVMVLAPRGLSTSLAESFVNAVKKELGGKVTESHESVKGGSGRAEALASIASGANQSVVIDCSSSGKKFSVMVVTASGNIEFDKTYTLPKQTKKQRGVVSDAARAAARAAKAVASSAPTSASSGTSGGGSPWTDPTGSTSPISSGGDGDDDSDDSTRIEARTSRKRGDGGFGLSFAVGAAGGGYSSTVDSTNVQGDRDITVSMSPQFGGGIRVIVDAITVDVRAAQQAAVLKPDVANLDQEINASTLKVNASLLYALTSGTWPISLGLGVGYESASVDDQPTIVWIPEESLIAPTIDVLIANGDLGTDGMVMEFALGVIPYGMHTRQADAFEVSSTGFGAQGALRARYQLPDMFTRAMGLFVEGHGGARYLSLSPGEAPVVPGTDLRSVSLPLGDEKSSRLDYVVGVNVGLMYRGD